ncbi:MAG: hypothetical protein N5P05_002614 [Chroococcopsis gigantea SAG 12.99]|jgi:hypothetical protein|nr:hypothetical protein [Chroococcopsis gigantea SAG 12.99]
MNVIGFPGGTFIGSIFSLTKIAGHYRLCAHNKELRQKDMELQKIFLDIEFSISNKMLNIYTACSSN